MTRINFKSKTLASVQIYNKLRDEWIANNPYSSDDELLKACTELAKACRLKLRNGLQNGNKSFK